MSVFQDVPETSWVSSNEHAFAFRDRYPVTRGHTLVVSRRVIEDWFGASTEERAALMELVDLVKRQLDDEFQPDGYNVGFNAGVAAGQTVMHLHVHVIPRYRGDMDDPRGGVRHVIPSRGNYLRDVAPLATGGEADPYARHVLPLFALADEIAIVAAFVQDSGLDRIEAAVHAALARGARIRIITGDYLDITQATALERLVDWQQLVGAEDQTSDELRGSFAARIVEVVPPRVRSFHPKSWRFEAPRFGTAFVGSSNLSRSALDTGIEWNLRVDRDRDAAAYERVRDAFEQQWHAARILDTAWVDGYARRVRRTQVPLPAGEIEIEELSPAVVPHEVQLEALERLRACRAQGRRRAVVVLATGLGKTWLAAFDFRQMREELGRMPRLLFIAHRRELLVQAAATYRRMMHELHEHARVGWFVNDESDIDGDLVFASVAKLSRREHLPRLHATNFDYVVLDEVHHAAAGSYRRILDMIDPGFLLGLTATPDRADSADVLGLFDDFVAYRADIPRGVALGRLAPFLYHGIRDDIDYANIPWRNHRFDPAALAAAAQTESRMERLGRALEEHPGQRSLIFCCSIDHARYVRAWLAGRNLRVAAVFSDEGSDDRETALRSLADGTLDAVCAVDIFNEGVDVPSIDRVVMLRPTESSVVFLQQLGRGLRVAEGKTSVTVIDFVGNHRVFLERLRTLLALGGDQSSSALRDLLAGNEPALLPEGCSVDLELEAKDLMRSLFRPSGVDEIERVYRELCFERGAAEDPSRRPTAGELQRMGYPPTRLRGRYGSWFDFVRGEGGLTAEESKAFDVGAAFLRELEVTEMTKSFKMITLEVLLEEGTLFTGMPLRDVAVHSHSLLRRSPELFEDVVVEERAFMLDAERERRWLTYWRKNPIAAWTTARKDGRAWFRLDGDRFVFNPTIDPGLGESFVRLVRELVDYRLARYRATRRESTATPEGFVCKIAWNGRDPILKLPARDGVALPEGETDVQLPDGRVWQFRFALDHCTVARPAGQSRNQLPDLLRGWFGPRAGQSGTSFQARFQATPQGLWIQPMQPDVIDMAPRRNIAAYPDLRVAAGHVAEEYVAGAGEVVALPLEDAASDLFAVRVSGSSMDGGKDPLRDGDWAVLRVARGMAAAALENRIVLVQVAGVADGTQFQIKRLRRDGRGWQLTSDNPAGPTIRGTEEMTPIARLERALAPETLAPAVGTVIAESELATRFGLDGLTATSGRHAGHFFIFIDAASILVESDRVKYGAISARPSETAFVLARLEQGLWRYLGVGRQTGERGIWSIPDVDLATWRTWGGGREVSRRLPEGSLARAQQVVEILLGDDDIEILLHRDGRRAFVRGAAPRGGIRIDGGPGGFVERTVSLQDLAWVSVAAADVAENGGVLDEARVNRHRYLEGTAQESTRWIDTGWAIGAWNASKDRVREAIAADAPPLKVRRSNGTELDAAFRLERVGDSATVVIEAAGGTKGTPSRINEDYREGFLLVLERLRALNISLAEIVVDSRETRKLPPDQRRVVIPERSFPLVIDDPATLRSEISAAAGRTGRRQGSKGGGNPERRLRLFLHSDAPFSLASLAVLLQHGRPG